MDTTGLSGRVMQVGISECGLAVGRIKARPHQRGFL